MGHALSLPCWSARRFLLLPLVLCLGFLVGPGKAEAAGLPDVVLESVKGAMVDVSTSKGQILTGLLIAFDEQAAILQTSDGSILALPTAFVGSIFLTAPGKALPFNFLDQFYAPRVA